MNTETITGLIISAGFSKRMGAFKPLLEYNGEPFIITITKKLLLLCERVIIVTGFRSNEIETVLTSHFSSQDFNNKITTVFNPDYEKEMFTSLQAGLKGLKNSKWVLYHFVDQPFLSENFYNDFISQLDAHYDWIQPTYNNSNGHPLIFNKRVADIIVNSPSDSNLRAVTSGHTLRKKYWNCLYPDVLKDFDTIEDIQNFTKE